MSFASRPHLPTLGILVCLVILAATGTAAAAPALPPGFQDTVAFPGLEKPTAVRFAPNGMVFVAEKAGKIEVYEGLGDETPELFKDLTLETYDKGDRGLLGLAIDPEFPAKPYVYALFTYDHIPGSAEPPPAWGSEEHPAGDSCSASPANGADDCLVGGRLLRYTAEVSEVGEGTLHATAIAETPLIAEDWCQQFSSHSIGDLRFGPEGALYAGGGDGASFNDADFGQLGEPPNPCDDPEDEGGSLRAQDLITPESSEDPTGLEGTIIRIDPETGKGWPTNPLADSASTNEQRIVATGFRNPFRFALDPKTGEMYVGNVGSSEYEEIDRFDPTGALYNSGWPCYEGDNPQYQFKTLELSICDDGLYEDPELVTQPLFYYSHRSPIAPGDECSYASGSAIAGPMLYQGEEFGPEYEGALFFADAVRGCFYVMPAGEDGRPDPDLIHTFMTGGSLYPGVDIEEGPDGLLYYASLFGEGFSEGAIHRIIYAPGSPEAKLTADSQFSEDVEHEFQLDASKSSDPDEEGLNFGWDLDGNGSFETEGGETQTVKYTKPENVVVAVKVTDSGEGLSNVAKLTLYPGDTPPVPTINAPGAGYLWGVGDEIHLSGSAKNSEGNSVEPLFLSWGTRILHCPTGSEDCHSHPLQDFPGTFSGDLVAPQHETPSYIEITLTASDKRGLSARKTIKLGARTVGLVMKTAPPGIPLTAGWLSQPAPFTLTTIEGSEVGLSAPQSAVLGGKTYNFQRWTDGDARGHTVFAGEGATYEAVYATDEELAAEEEEPASAEEAKPPSGGPGDTTPPRTTIRRHPPKSTRSKVARFVFRANERARFRCKLDRTAYRACRSPKTYRRLKPGRHVFRVFAIDGTGNRGAKRAFTWKVSCAKGRKTRRRHLRHQAHRHADGQIHVHARAARRSTRRSKGCAS